MPVQALNHFNIRPWDLEATKEFYVEVVGLEVGYRPPVGFPGYWLYSGDQALVHLMGPRPGEDPPKPPPEGQSPSTGYVDHIAFAASDLRSVRERLTQRAVPFTEREVPRDGQILVTVMDQSNGVRVELVFDAAEGAAGQ
jgi:catechol 2,3-dioxygenase-like lactoylglutathione lyase family enzyme